MSYREDHPLLRNYSPDPSETSAKTDISDSDLPPDWKWNDIVQDHHIEDSGVDPTDELSDFFQSIDLSTALQIRSINVSDFTPKETAKRVPKGKTEEIAPQPNTSNEPFPATVVPDFEDFESDRIYKCLQETCMAAVEPVMKATKGLRFSYYDFQAAIQLEFELRKWYFLWTKLFETKTSPLQPPAADSETVKNKFVLHFQSIYGPVDMNNPANQRYLAHFFNCLKENMVDLEKQLNLFQAIANKHGIVVVQAILLSQRLELLDVECSFTNDPNNRLIYDLNPFTSPTHLDWFILERGRYNENNMIIQHDSLSRVEKPALTDQAKNKELLTIPGIWLSLVDIFALRPTRIVRPLIDAPPGLDKEAAEDEQEVDPQELEQYKEKQMFMESLVRRMIKMISLFPLGIRLEEFFERVRRGKYTPDAALFGETSLEDAVKSLPDIFLIVNLHEFPKQRGERMIPNKPFMLLFPAYLRGIVPDNPTLMIERIWERIIFLVEAAPGSELDITLVEATYWQHFNSRISVAHWGFASMDTFVGWCKRTFDTPDGKKMRITTNLAREKMLQFTSGKKYTKRR